MNMKKINYYKKIINIPNNEKIQKKNLYFIIKGPLGVNIVNLSKYDKKGKIFFKINETNIVLLTLHKNLFNTIYTLIINKIHGVMNGFLLYIQIYGIGYKCEIKQTHKPNFNYFGKQQLHFKIGFSHLFKYICPKSVKFFLLQPTLICLYGIDKNKISEIYARIKQKKPATIYKGKGFRLLNEKIYLKTTKR